MTYSEFRKQFLTVEGFMQAYGALSIDEAKALINEEKASPSIKAWMITKWREARRRVKLQNISVNMRNDGGLCIVFYKDNSEFDGNDFEYRYTLDSNNTKTFLTKLQEGWADKKTNIEEWLVKNVNCEGIGGDLQQKWIQMGLHGSHVVWEDYPGGIHREEEF